MKRWLLVALGVVVLLPVLAVGGFLLFFDAESVKSRIAASVTQATGRAFAIEGKLTLKPSLRPTIAAENLVLANLPGGTAPEMLRLRRAELRLALLPLLSGRMEVDNLSLEGGALLLERDNWRFARPEAPPNPNARPAAPAREPMVLDIRRVSLRDWTITTNGEAWQLPRATLTGHGPGQPYDVTATVIARGAEALIEGRGTMEGGRVTVNLPGARVTVEAARAGADWRGTLAAEAPQLAALSRLAGRELPALTGVTIRAAGGWVGGAAQLASLDARATGGGAMGATLSGAQLTMASADGPAKLEARGRFRDQDIVVTAEATPLALRAGTPAPVSLRMQGAGADVMAAGTWPGALRVQARVPELAALAGLLAVPLPPLRDVTLTAGVAARGPGGAAVSDLAFASSGGDLRGAVEIVWAPRPSLRGRLASTRLDLAAFRPVPATAPAAPTPAVPAPTPAPAAPARPAPRAADGRLIPDLPVDLAALRLFDADLTFEVGELRQGATVLRQVAGRLVNEAGKARLDPFAATWPAGRLALRVAADATASPPALQVAGGGQGLDLAALTASGRGRADLDMDLRGQGVTTRALAASATGQLGLAVTDGALTGAWAREAGRLIPGSGDSIPLACAAMRWEADRGMARTRVFYLEGAPGRAAGEGTLNLRDESIAARLNLDLRVAGVRVRAPVPVTGTLAAPRLETQGLLQGALSGDLGEQLERAIPGLGGVLPQQSGGPAMPDCATALRIARNGREGPVPAARAQPAPPASGAGQGLEGLLRGLLR